MEILKTKNISKNFGGVQALRGVNFSLEKSESLALIGENGAGKSTLMKIISGVYPHGQFTGEILIEGKPVKLKGTKDAEHLGISIIHQELNLFSELSVGENIFLSNLPKKKFGQVDYNQINKASKEILDRLGVNLNPELKVGQLNTGNQQMVEIAKALSQKARVLILDEPTSSLTTNEIDKLFKVLKDLQKKGMAIIYISHKLEEVFSLCNKLTVLRDGQSVFHDKLSRVDEATIINNMVGRELKDLYPTKKKLDLEKNNKKYIGLEVKNWSAYKICEKKFRVQNVNFKAYRGEILGICGIMGAGRTDLS